MGLIRSYYIPGNAVVFGTINNGERAHNNDGSNIRWLHLYESQVSDGDLGNKNVSAIQISRIFGHGTLSGELIPQPKSVEPPIEESEYWKYKSININNADNITVDGITVVNAAFHTFNLVMIQSTAFSTVVWKVFSKFQRDCS